MDVVLGKVHWREGYHSKVDAVQAHAEIEKIRKAKGSSVTASDLVGAAKNKKNVLHDAFEWDDSKAGREHRLEQGRCMLRSLVIVRLEAPDVQTRAYEITRLPADDIFVSPRKVYNRMEDILKDPDARAQLCDRAFAEIASWAKRYSHLPEMKAIVASINRTIKRYPHWPAGKRPVSGKRLRKAGPPS